MKIDPRQFAIYVGAIALPVVIIVVLLLKLIPQDDGGDEAPLQSVEQVQEQASAADQADSDAPPVEEATVDAVKPQPVVTAKSDTKKSIEGKTGGKKVGDKVKRVAAQPNTAKSTTKNARAKSVSTVSATEAYISIACQEGTQVFVDGSDKGKVASTVMTLAVPPGNHKVIVASKSGSLHTQSVQSELGKTVSVKPGFCG